MTSAETASRPAAATDGGVLRSVLRAVRGISVETLAAAAAGAIGLIAIAFIVTRIRRAKYSDGENGPSIAG